MIIDSAHGLLRDLEAVELAAMRTLLLIVPLIPAGAGLLPRQHDESF